MRHDFQIGKGHHSSALCFHLRSSTKNTCMCLHGQASQSPKIPLSSCSLRINLGSGWFRMVPACYSNCSSCGSRHSGVPTVERGQPTTWPKWSLVPRLSTLIHPVWLTTGADINRIQLEFNRYQLYSDMRNIAQHSALRSFSHVFTCFHSMFSRRVLECCLGHGQGPRDAKHVQAS